MSLVLPTFAGFAQPAGSSFSTKALDFDGTDDYLSIASSSDFEFGTGNFSISFWFKMDSIGTDPNSSYYPFIDFRPSSSSTAAPSFYISTQTGYRFYVWNGSGLVANYNTTPSTGQWYHGAYTRDGTTGTIYLNGSAVATGTDSTNYNTTPAPRIGGPPSGVTASYLDGKIDEVALFGSALSSSDITAIYNSGTPADLSGYTPVGWWRMGDGTEAGSGTTVYDMSSNSNDGTLVNGPAFSPAVPPGYSTKALDFDGTDDYVNCGGASTFSFTNGLGNDEPFSISAWVKLDSVDRARVVSKDDGTDGTREYLFGTDGDDRFCLFLGPASNNLYVRLNSASSTGTWYHWVATYDGSNSASGITLYVDGATPAQSDVSGGTYAGMPSGGGPLRIGLFGVNSSVMNGLADEVAIFDSELSASDVTSIYNSGVPADLSSLSPVGWWRMGEDATWDGTNWTIPDDSTNSNSGTTANMAEASRVTDTP